MAAHNTGSTVTDFCLPLHLYAPDHFGINMADGMISKESHVLRAVYGLCQVVCDGMPDFQDRGRAEVAIASLFREATLALGAGLILSARRLYEPTLSISQGVFAARLQIKRLRDGDSETVASLLIADRLLSRKRDLRRQIDLGLRPADDPCIRDRLYRINHVFKHDEELRAAKAALKSLKKRNPQWHRAGSLEELAEQLRETQSHQADVPTTSFFAGDPDAYLDGERAVGMGELVCTDDTKLIIAQQSLITDGHRLLDPAVSPWEIGADVRMGIEQALPLMIISLNPLDTPEPRMRQLEQESGLPRAEWTSAMTVSFSGHSSPERPPLEPGIGLDASP